MERILVLRGGALGDFIVTLPALALLRQRWPRARIELAGNAAAAVLAINRGLLDAAHPQHEARWAALFAPGPLPAEFAAWLASFDLVVNYWPDPDADLARRFPQHPRQRFLTAPALPVAGPAARHYAAPLAALGLGPGASWVPLVKPPAGARSGPVAIHPDSGSPRKNWPDDRWLELLARLPRPVDAILGEAEEERWAARLQAAGVTLHLRRPLEDLVGVLARARCFVGHDSGISHLAAACGVPAVLLFGPTEPTIWAPPAPAVRVLRRGASVADLTLADVAEGVRAALADPP